MHPILKIGTRASPLARQQAQLVVDMLIAAHPQLSNCLEIVPLTTRGDSDLSLPFDAHGRKGLFTAEIDAQLNAGTLDIAVHSLKDLPTENTQGLMLGAVPARSAPEDMLIAAHPLACTEPRAAIKALTHIGTASCRRAAQLYHINPALKISIMRGNIGTRLEKLAAGTCDATILAHAGLIRLNKATAHQMILPPEIMLPAAGQGALGIMCRTDDTKMRALLTPINDRVTALCTTAERSFLGALDGSCHTPIAAYATYNNNMNLNLRGRILSDDGRNIGEAQNTAHVNTLETAQQMGRILAVEIRTRHPNLVPV